MSTSVFCSRKPPMLYVTGPAQCWFHWLKLWHPWRWEGRQSRETDRGQSSDSRPVVGGAVAAVVLVGEERALDKDTWLGLETLVTSWFWLVVDDWRLRAPGGPWNEVPLLKVLTTSICGRRERGTTGHNGFSERERQRDKRLNGRLAGWYRMVRGALKKIKKQYREVCIQYAFGTQWGVGQGCSFS